MFRILTQISNILWGTPMTIVLIGTGIYLSIRFGFRYNFRKIKFHFQNTFGKMFQPGQGTGSVSGFAAACTAMVNTIGVGNIGGVASAIVSGGPGAIFWMWVSGLFGMSTKACEIILGQRYRVKYNKSMDEYMCDRSFVMRNALGWKTGAVILAFACFILGPWTCCVQTEAVTSSLKEGFQIPPILSVSVLGITCFLTIFGGFAGATVRDAIRYGVARGLYSNDAGTGYGIIAHASAKTDHPVRQSSWGWGEVFLDTIVVCSVTALSLILTNVYIDYPNISSARLTTVAFKVAYGHMGGWFISVAIAVFAWTTIIGMYYSCEKSVNYAFGDTKRNKLATKIYMIYYMLPCVLFYNIQADSLWAMTDILSAIYIIITLIFIYSKQKVIMDLFHDFWFRFIPEKEVGLNPEPVVFGKEESEYE